MTEEKNTAFDAKSFLRGLTHRPGVYRMLNANGNVIYVGKALDLKKRVSTYFHKTHADPKTSLMMRRFIPDVGKLIANQQLRFGFAERIFLHAQVNHCAKHGAMRAFWDGGVIRFFND